MASRTDTLQTIPDNLFEGGEEMFYQIMTKHIEYPTETRSTLQVGTEIVAFKIDRHGELDSIEFLNSISPHIDKEILNSLRKTRRNWLPSRNEDEHVFLLPIRFDISGCSYLREKPPTDKFCKEITVKVASSGTEHDQYFTSDDVLIQKYYTLRKLTKLKEAKEVLKELIDRNPFNEEAIEERLKLNTVLGLIDEVCKDVIYLKAIFNLNREVEGCN
ncbi:energy transducer TonB [Bacteroidota bacterium]